MVWLEVLVEKKQQSQGPRYELKSGGAKTAEGLEVAVTPHNMT